MKELRPVGWLLWLGSRKFFGGSLLREVQATVYDLAADRGYLARVYVCRLNCLLALRSRAVIELEPSDTLTFAPLADVLPTPTRAPKAAGMLSFKSNGPVGSIRVNDELLVVPGFDPEPSELRQGAPDPSVTYLVGQHHLERVENLANCMRAAARSEPMAVNVRLPGLSGALATGIRLGSTALPFGLIALASRC